MKLNLGSGKRNLEGFTNVDAVKHTEETVVADILNLPYEQSSIKDIYSEHVLEHLDRKELNILFKECYRVLIPEGKLTLVAPCLVNTIKDYVDDVIDIEYLDNFLFALHEHEYDYHKQGIHKLKLEALCNKYNFKVVKIINQTRGREREIVLVATAIKDNK